jgi:hypothetical protein
VIARVVWEDDGEEYIETVATGWTGRLVYVASPIDGTDSRPFGSMRRTSPALTPAGRHFEAIVRSARAGLLHLPWEVSHELGALWSNGRALHPKRTPVWVEVLDELILHELVGSAPAQVEPAREHKDRHAGGTGPL